MKRSAEAGRNFSQVNAPAGTKWGEPYIKNAVQDAWFDKATSHGGWDETGSTHIPKGMGDELTSVKPGGVKPGTPSGRAGRSPSKQAAMKDADSNRRAGQTPYLSESKERRKDNEISDMSVYHKKKAIESDELRNDNRWNQPSAKPRRDELTSVPTRTPGKGQTAKFREGKWESKMQKAVWDAWMEKKEEGADQVTGRFSEEQKKITNPNNPFYTGKKKGDKSFRSKHEWDDTTPHAESYAEWKERLSKPDTQE
jgi:hypothetical protein